MHDCPAEGCETRVSDDLLMCRKHWRLVGSRAKSAVYRAWRNGAGAGTPEHIRACRNAVLEAEAAERRRHDQHAAHANLRLL